MRLLQCKAINHVPKPARLPAWVSCVLLPSLPAALPINATLAIHATLMLILLPNFQSRLYVVCSDARNVISEVARKDPSQQSHAPCDEAGRGLCDYGESQVGENASSKSQMDPHHRGEVDACRSSDQDGAVEAAAVEDGAARTCPAAHTDSRSGLLAVPACRYRPDIVDSASACYTSASFPFPLASFHPASWPSADSAASFPSSGRA